MHIRSASVWRRKSSLALAILASASTASEALAQPSDRATALEEVVVTAQRRESSLQDTPIAITAFTADKLGNLGAFNVSQIADFVPNLTIQRQPGSSSSMGVFMRGVGSGETSLISDPKVGIYIDGVYISKTAGALFDVADMERIEALRGPQGTLFGRNTTGGALNVTTRKPTGELGGKVAASVGNYGYLRYGGSLDLPAVANVAAKLAYNHMETDGWADNNYDGAPLPPSRRVEEDLASEDNDAWRLALRWTPRDDLTVDYSFDRTDNVGVPTPYQQVVVKNSVYDGFTTAPRNFQLIGGSLYQQMAANVGDPKNRRKNFELDGQADETLEVDGHAFTAAWEATENLTLKYIFGSRSTDIGTGSTDLDSGAYTARDLFYGVFRGQNGEIPMVGYHGATPKSWADTDSHEFQFIGDAFDERLKYTAGLFYFEEEAGQHLTPTFSVPISYVAPRGANTPVLGPLYAAAGFCPPEFGGALCVGTQRLPIPGAADILLPGVNDFEYGQDAESRAAYGQASYDLSDQLTLTFGLRYTEDEKEAYLWSQTVAGTSPSNPALEDESWDNLSYLVNGNYAITEDVAVYLSYTTGYNAGGFNARATNVASFRTPYAEEEVETWELGVKSEFFDNRLRFNAAIFDNDYTDIQINQFEAGTGGASSRIVNAGAGTYRGVEFDIVAVPFEGLTLDLSYGYLDAEFDEYLARNPVTNQLDDISDRTTVGQAPESTASLGLQYDFVPFSFGSLSTRLDVAYKDEFVFHPINNQYDSTDPRTLVNGRISLDEIRMGCCSDRNALRVSLWGRNLTDEEYRNWGIDFGTLGFAGVTYGEPRTYGLDVVYTYR